VTVSGESALLVSHLSAFSYISGSSMNGTLFQGLSAEGSAKKSETYMDSLKDAQKMVQEGKFGGWWKLVQLPENKRNEGLGFSVNKPGVFNPTEGTFHSAGFIHASSETNAIIEDQAEEVEPVFVTPGGTCHNWVAVNTPSVITLSK